jgi:hypothetical protein
LDRPTSSNQEPFNINIQVKINSNKSISRIATIKVEIKEVVIKDRTEEEEVATEEATITPTEVEEEECSNKIILLDKVIHNNHMEAWYHNSSNLQ